MNKDVLRFAIKKKKKYSWKNKKFVKECSLEKKKIFDFEKNPKKYWSFWIQILILIFKLETTNIFFFFSFNLLFYYFILLSGWNRNQRWLFEWGIWFVEDVCWPLDGKIEFSCNFKVNNKTKIRKERNNNVFFFFQNTGLHHLIWQNVWQQLFGQLHVLMSRNWQL